jgi:hypothetical protein
MALVAVGLLLILWRMLTGKSATWLVNANAAAAGLALVAGSTIDLGSVAAAWNIRHAREVGGRGAALDLCYLGELGSSALVSLVELEQTPGLNADFAARVAWVRDAVDTETHVGQAHGWWTWRNARRIAQVAAMTAQTPLAPVPDKGPYGRDCDGKLSSPPPPVATMAPEADTVIDPAMDPGVDNAGAAATTTAGAFAGETPPPATPRLTKGATR